MAFSIFGVSKWRWCFLHSVFYHVVRLWYSDFYGRVSFGTVLGAGYVDCMEVSTRLQGLSNDNESKMIDNDFSGNRLWYGGSIVSGDDLLQHSNCVLVALLVLRLCQSFALDKV